MPTNHPCGSGCGAGFWCVWDKLATHGEAGPLCPGGGRVLARRQGRDGRGRQVSLPRGGWTLCGRPSRPGPPPLLGPPLQAALTGRASAGPVPTPGTLVLQGQQLGLPGRPLARGAPLVPSQNAGLKPLPQARGGVHGPQRGTAPTRGHVWVGCVDGPPFGSLLQRVLGFPRPWCTSRNPKGKERKGRGEKQTHRDTTLR